MNSIVIRAGLNKFERKVDEHNKNTPPMSHNCRCNVGAPFDYFGILEDKGANMNAGQIADEYSIFQNCRCAVTKKSESAGKKLVGDIQFVGDRTFVVHAPSRINEITGKITGGFDRKQPTELDDEILTYTPRHPEWVYQKFCGLFKFCNYSQIYRVYPSAHFFTRVPLVTNTITLDSHSLDIICEIFRNAERIEPMPDQLLPKFRTQQRTEKIESYNIKFPLLAKYLG